MKGSVMPVSGMRRVTPPTITNDCSAIVATSPVAVSDAMSERARTAVASPRRHSTRYAATMAAPPMRPSSSPMAEKMKSVTTKGMRVGRPCPGPTPVNPPAARANSDCTSW